MTINGTAVSASSSVRDLGMHIDADLVMRTHVQKTVSRCFAVLRQLRQIRRSVPQPAFQSLVVALKGELAARLRQRRPIGHLAYLMRRLQSVLNAAARLIFNLRRSDHVHDALISLHWLRVSERITSKVSVLVYKASTAVHRRALVRPVRSRCQRRTELKILTGKQFIKGPGLAFVRNH